MDPERLAYGRYVVWDPPEDLQLPSTDLERGHPGVIVGPHWQDVGVKWLFRERDTVSQHVYHYDWLREVDAAEFAEAVSIVAVRYRDSSASRPEW